MVTTSKNIYINSERTQLDLFRVVKNYLRKAGQDKKTDLIIIIAYSMNYILLYCEQILY